MQCRGWGGGHLASLTLLKWIHMSTKSAECYCNNAVSCVRFYSAYPEPFVNAEDNQLCV